MSRKVVVFLQNAWSPLYGGGVWPRESWLKALWRSRSGQRLSTLLRECPSVTVWVDNTTPIVGETPGSVVPPDQEHIRSVLAEQRPDVLVACGRQAADALHGLCSLPTLLLPHPAYRLLTNAVYVEAGRLVESGFNGTLRLPRGS